MHNRYVAVVVFFATGFIIIALAGFLFPQVKDAANHLMVVPALLGAVLAGVTKPSWRLWFFPVALALAFLAYRFGCGCEDRLLAWHVISISVGYMVLCLAFWWLALNSRPAVKV